MDLTCVSPIPSRSYRLFKISFLFLKLNNSENFLSVLKKAAKIFAFSWPICLIPIEQINLFKTIFFELLIAFCKFFIESFPQPSKPSIFPQFKQKISAGVLTSFESQKLSITFFPKPSISNASFEAICFNLSFAVKSHS